MGNKFTASFMIVLILTLPIYIANVFAASGSLQIEVYGVLDDGTKVENYMKPDDTLLVEVKAKIIDNNNQPIVVSPEHVRRKHSSTQFRPFDSCESTPDIYDKYKCVYERDLQDISPGPLIIRVELFATGDLNDITFSLDSRSKTITIDGTAPVIYSFNMPNIVGKGQIELTLNIDDPAGIGLIHIGDENTIDLGNPIQFIDGKITFSPSNYFNDGANTICLYPSDSIGNIDEVGQGVCDTFTLDTLPPYTCQITVHGGTNIYISPNSNLVDVKLTVRDDTSGLLQKKSKAYFYELNENPSSVQPNDCTKIPTEVDKWECFWNDVAVTKEGTVKIIINATDDAGNGQPGTTLDTITSCMQTFTIQTDDSTPALTSDNIKILNLKTNQETDYIGMLYNRLIVTIDESGSGVEPDNIKANIPIGNTPTGEIVAADGKINDNIFYWDFNLSNGRFGTRTIDITEITDNVGNSITAPASKTFTYDTDAPSNIIIDSIETLEGLSYFKSNDLLVITITGVDDGSGIWKVFANFSQLGGNNGKDGKESTDCVNHEDGTWTCSIQTERITGPKSNVKMQFAFYDKVNNNELIESDPIQILVQAGQIIEYWNIVDEEGKLHLRDGYTPLSIDREITKLRNSKINHFFHLEQEQGDFGCVPEILKIGFRNCESNPGIPLNTILKSGEHFVLLNGDFISVENGKSSEIFAKTTLNKIDITDDYLLDDVLPLNCTINIASKCGNEISTERDFVIADIPFFNNPLGTIDESVNANIRAVQNSGLVKQKWIGTARKFIDTSQKVCEGLRIYGSVALLVSFAHSHIAPVLDALRITPFFALALAVAEGDTATHGIYAVLYDGTLKYCKFLSCDYSFWIFDKMKQFTTNLLGFDAVAGAFGIGQRIDEPGNPIGEDGLGGRFNTNPDAFMNPKDSLILSAATGCLPGVIYNLDKAREIECTYIYCMQKMVPAGAPTFLCDSIRMSSWCKYVWGELFKVMPLTAFLDYVTNTIKAIISNPLALASAAGCMLLPKISNTATSVCTRVNNLKLLNDIISNIRNIKNWNLQIPRSVCDEIEPVQDSGNPSGNGGVL